VFVDVDAAPATPGAVAWAMCFSKRFCKSKVVVLLVLNTAPLTIRGSELESGRAEPFDDEKSGATMLVLWEILALLVLPVEFKVAVEWVLITAPGTIEEVEKVEIGDWCC